MNVPRFVLVTALVFALASAPGAALAASDGTASGATGPTALDPSVAALSDSTVENNTTDGTTQTVTDTVDDTTNATGDATESVADTVEDTTTVEATADGTDSTVDGIVDDSAQTTVAADATLDGDADVATGVTDTGVDADVSQNVSLGSTAERDRVATPERSATTRAETGDAPDDTTPADGRSRAASNASAAGDGRAGGAPLGPLGDSGVETPVAGGAAVGASAVGAGLLARRTGVISGLQPVARPAASSAVHVASALPEWTRTRFWRLVALGGYQRYADDDPLEHEARADIYEHLVASPGSYLSEVSEETGVPLSTVRYHVRILAFENLVRDVDLHGKRRYFPLETDPNELDVALADDAPAAVLETLVRQGPDSVSGLAEKLDRDPSTVTHHLQRLEDDGLVERERDGRAVVNRVVPAVEAALDDPVEKPDATASRTKVDAD
jgi:DNA-binding transcriptional ArsR family regulator